MHVEGTHVAVHMTARSILERVVADLNATAFAVRSDRVGPCWHEGSASTPDHLWSAGHCRGDLAEGRLIYPFAQVSSRDDFHWLIAPSTARSSPRSSGSATGSARKQSRTQGRSARNERARRHRFHYRVCPFLTLTVRRPGELDQPTENAGAIIWRARLGISNHRGHAGPRWRALRVCGSRRL